LQLSRAEQQTAQERSASADRKAYGAGFGIPTSVRGDISATAELDDLPKMLPVRAVTVVVNGWIGFG